MCSTPVTLGGGIRTVNGFFDESTVNENSGASPNTGTTYLQPVHVGIEQELRYLTQQ